MVLRDMTHTYGLWLEVSVSDWLMDMAKCGIVMIYSFISVMLSMSSMQEKDGLVSIIENAWSNISRT